MQNRIKIWIFVIRSTLDILRGGLVEFCKRQKTTVAIEIKRCTYTQFSFSKFSVIALISKHSPKYIIIINGITVSLKERKKERKLINPGIWGLDLCHKHFKQSHRTLITPTANSKHLKYMCIRTSYQSYRKPLLINTIKLSNYCFTNQKSNETCMTKLKAFFLLNQFWYFKHH